MTENIASLFYLLSSVCFVLAIRGLSAPDTANRGNLFGILGMVLAVATTLAMPIILSYELIICLLYTSPSPRDRTRSRMPSSA